jgi:hypothetical protein
MRKLLLGMAGTAVILAAASAHAQRFEATVPSENITLDQNVELTVTLERDGSQPFESYRAPQAPDFDLLHTGTSEQMQFATVNGKQSVRMVEQHVYVFKPKKKGALTIAPATVRIAGQELRTRNLVIHVGAPLKNAISSAQQSGQQAPAQPLGTPPPVPESLRADDELFVDARVDKPKLYVGQQLTASWYLYTQSEILKYRPLAEPKHEDFWNEDLFVPTSHLAWDRSIIKGHEFAVALLLRKALFPLKAGKLTITPLEAEATTLRTAFYASASDTRKSKALTVEVLPLPAAGRPSDFQAANVGHFELASTVDRSQVKAGEAVTWKLTVSGTGNIRNVRLPAIERIDGFRVYEPTTKQTIEPGEQVRGAKTYTYLLLPQRGGTLALPAVDLPYFDPESGKYAVARTQAVAIKVEGDPRALETGQPGNAQENVLAPQIRPIRNRQTVHSRVGERLWRGRLAWLLLAAPPGLWLLVLVGDALRRRLARETAGSKRRRARRSARRRLRVAEYHIKAARPSAFFGECARVLYEHLEYRLGAKVEALTLGELREHLVKSGFSRETAEAVVRELENCDFARFAPSASGPGEMRAALRRVRTLLPLIEKVKPSETEEAA